MTLIWRSRAFCHLATPRRVWRCVEWQRSVGVRMRLRARSARWGWPSWELELRPRRRGRRPHGLCHSPRPRPTPTTWTSFTPTTLVRTFNPSSPHSSPLSPLPSPTLFYVNKAMTHSDRCQIRKSVIVTFLFLLSTMWLLPLYSIKISRHTFNCLLADFATNFSETIFLHTILDTQIF